MSEDEDFDQTAWYQQELDERHQKENELWARQPKLMQELETSMSQAKVWSEVMDRLFYPAKLPPLSKR